MMQLYMIVTADKYELPLIVSDNCKDLAEYSGKELKTVYSSISKGLDGKVNGYKFVKVPVEGD